MMNGKVGSMLLDRTLRSAVVVLLLLLLGSSIAGGALAQGTPTLDVVSPANGAAIHADDIQVQVKVSGLKLDCSALGRPDQPGVGEILALIDGTSIAQLANFYCTDTFTISGEGLAPGKHTLAFVLASNTHAPMMDTAKQVAIDFQPSQPVPLPASDYRGDPGVKLLSPQDGATVPAVFPVQVAPINFTPDNRLEGKTNVPGYGHYHVWVDASAKPSSLANLVLMPGTNGFTLDLSAWGPGQHTIRIEPAQNDHTMYQPATAATFTVTVAPGAGATPAAAPEASPAASTAATVTIKMTDDLKFDPADVTIPLGATVTWVNASSVAHTSTDDPAKNPVAQAHPEFAQLPAGATPWDSGMLQPGQSFVHVFTVSGAYQYFCIPHVLSGMRGTITVRG